MGRKLEMLHRAPRPWRTVAGSSQCSFMVFCVPQSQGCEYVGMGVGAGVWVWVCGCFGVAVCVCVCVCAWLCVRLLRPWLHL